MKTITKTLLFRASVVMPFGWWGLTAAAACITAYHGYSIYFVYLALLTVVFSIPGVLISYKSFYLTSALCFLGSAAFNAFALILLFFPQWNGWGNWNPDGRWNRIFFTFPPDFNYWVIGLFFLLFIFFGIKKFLEIDYLKMKNEIFKNQLINKFEGEIYLNKGLCLMSILCFNIRFLAKTEYYLYMAGFFIFCAVALPMRNLGTVAPDFGNNEFITLFFFVGTYLCMWFSYWWAMTLLAQYRLINKIEKELGFKLKPALKDD